MLRLTKICRRIVYQYYGRRWGRDSSRESPAYKAKYRRVVYELRFPKGFPIEDLEGREVEFIRRGDEVIIRPKDAARSVSDLYRRARFETNPPRPSPSSPSPVDMKMSRRPQI